MLNQQASSPKQMEKPGGGGKLCDEFLQAVYNRREKACQNWEAPLEREGEGPCFHDFPVFRARGTQNLEAQVAFSKLPQRGCESPKLSFFGAGWAFQEMGLDCAIRLQTQLSAESRLLYLPLQILFLNLGSVIPLRCPPGLVPRFTRLGLCNRARSEDR